MPQFCSFAEVQDQRLDADVKVSVDPEWQSSEAREVWVREGRLWKRRGFVTAIVAYSLRWNFMPSSL